MTRDEANAVYDILVRECGAAEGDDRHWNGRASFVREFTKEQPTIEYRFQGALGFGGKFYPGDMRVSCYPEDETPKREEMVRRANEALRALSSGSAPGCRWEHLGKDAVLEHTSHFQGQTWAHFPGFRCAVAFEEMRPENGWRYVGPKAEDEV